MAGTTTLEAHRGRLLDRSGRELAVSVRRHGCAIDPQRVQSMEVTIGALEGALGLRREEIDAMRSYIARRRAAGHECRFAWVRRALMPEEVEAVERLNLPGVMLTRDWARQYPQGRTACHVVGFTRRDGPGLEGLELALDSQLQGRAGSLRINRDARRRAVLTTPEIVKPRRDGTDVMLTLDTYIQTIVERQLDRIVEEYNPEQATAVVMAPYSGAVLALANRPAFDANRAREEPQEARFNPAVAGIYEPGSVFKPFVLAAALEEGAVDLDTPIHCEGGAWNLGYRVLNDTHGYGTLPAAKVVIKSSNIGIAKIARRVGMRKLHAWLSRFGFGEETGIELPGEVGGIFRPVSEWNPRFSMTSVPMGQEVSVTPVQLTAAFCALVNGGVLVRPRLVEATIHEDGGTSRKPVLPLRRVVSETVADQVRQVLARVVAEGTGRRAKSESYTIGGKTGTAQIAGPGGYEPGAYVASFCGFAPVEAPRLVVLVSVTRPQGAYYGGTVSAPAVRAILEKALLYCRVPANESELAAVPVGRN
jgi:cell division protein FtsI (penicillin-binding protein 3)